MSHAATLSEECGVVFIERDGVSSVLHRAIDNREIWRETYQVLIVLWCSHPPRPQPTPAPKQHAPNQKRSRKEILNAEIGAFLKQYARKAHAGHDPNDRHYSRKIEGVVKRMKPADFAALTQDAEDEMTGGS